MVHKAGFVNIIGSPNVGKSTLMNVLVGERLSIITSKAQTTRHRIMGIVNGEDFQIVYSDTPGVLKPNYKLQASMMDFVYTAITDADIMLFVTDIFEDIKIEEQVLHKIKNAKVPVLLLVNKIDLAVQDQLETKVQYWKTEVPNAEVIPVSALEKFNVSYIFDRILALLPEGPGFYAKDQLTDKPEKFFISEIIREKILMNYKKEIPYSVEVVIESFKEEEKIVKIRAEILVIRDSQKGIIIGHQGKALKKVGTDARKDMETFLQKQVFLELFVKVNKDWRDSDNQLKRFGYSS
ncbi:MAG: GTPase Era [Bacteroidota bacterium]|nr:GTPase Era [Bacteroidia bacterium]MDP1746655.1 GTPase Era [Bacteroidota bacterium]